MSIASELARLQQAKADIKAAIVAKGVEVPSSALIDTYDDYIAQIEGGGGCSVASANSITFDAMGRVSSVSYKEGVTEIPDYMFSNDTSLTSVTLPSTLTRIGNSAFNNCGGLTSITIPLLQLLLTQSFLLLEAPLSEIPTALYTFHAIL